MFVQNLTSDPNRPPIVLRNVSKKFALRKNQQRSLQEQFIRLFRRGKQLEPELFVPLRNISLTVRQGDTIGIVGPNGTGKSTLLKLITGIIEPDAGDVVVNGRLSSLLELGAGFHPDLTGRENIFLNASIYGLSRREIAERLETIIEFSELGKFINMPVKHYSSGMYVRLGFAVAIHTDPEILLVDEVLAVGDAHFQTKCIDAIQDFRTRGGTLILVSHDLGTIQSICSRAIWFEGGAVQADGAPMDVIMAYKKRIADQENQTQQESAPITQRWGSGDVQITHVELRDGEGKARTVFYTGEPQEICIRYRAPESVQDLVIGLAIHHQNGTHLAGPNTSTGGLILAEAHGEDEVVYRIPALPLLEGTYLLSVAATNRADTVIFDYHDRAYQFRVFPGDSQELYGLIMLGGTWCASARVGEPALNLIYPILSPDRSPRRTRRLHRDRFSLVRRRPTQCAPHQPRRDRQRDGRTGDSLSQPGARLEPARLPAPGGADCIRAGRQEPLAAVGC